MSGVEWHSRAAQAQARALYCDWSECSTRSAPAKTPTLVWSSSFVGVGVVEDGEDREKTRSGGIELGELVRTARRTSAHEGILSL